MSAVTPILPFTPRNLSVLRACTQATALGLGLLLSAGSWAQSTAPCDGTQANKSTCHREAAAAKQDQRRGNLNTPASEVARNNALARCNAHKDADNRAACESRVLGTGNTTISGSVAGGGLLRETIITVPAQ